MTTLRICFVGDSLTNGTNDSEFKGWPGRLCAAEQAVGHDLTHYNLGIRAETSEDIERRWQAECTPRLLDNQPGAVVFSFGVNDMAILNGDIRVPVEQSLESAKRIMEEAKRWKPTLWVGPVPIDDGQQPFHSAPGVSYHFSTERLAELCREYQKLAREMDIPYLEMLQPMLDKGGWHETFIDGDGVHPGHAGYALMAERIARWPAWRAWLDT